MNTTIDEAEADWSSEGADEDETAIDEDDRSFFSDQSTDDTEDEEEEDHSMQHQNDEYIIDEAHEGDNDWDESSARYYRFLSIASLSCILVVLVISFGYQMIKLRDTLQNAIDNEKTRSTTSSGSNSRILLDMLASDPSQSKPKQSTDPITAQSEDYVMPRDATRIYTHASLTSKNYRAGGILSDDMLKRYERDGVLVIRNLVPPKLLDRLNEAGNLLIGKQELEQKGRRKGKQFHLVHNGAIFLGVPSPEDSTCNIDAEQCDARQSIDQVDNTTVLSSFRDLAMYSKIPRVAASLLRLDELRVGGVENLREQSRKRTNQYKKRVDDSINLRICRDIFLTKDNDPYACGWHVDDTGFWPSVAEDPGVNAWIALDDMPWPNTENRNSSVATFALSLGSHRVPWRHEAYHVTGSTHTQPPEGFQSAADLIERRTGSGTCNIKTSAPDLYRKLEERKVVYDLKRGDVIFHDRWVFHRTVTVDEYSRMAGIQQKESSESNDKIFKRYSIRYSPGTARVPPGFGFELSALYNFDNANSTLDEIVERDGPFYPKVWPHVLKRKPNDRGYYEEIDGLTELVQSKIPLAEKIQKERKKEVNMLLSARGRVD